MKKTPPPIRKQVAATAPKMMPMPKIPKAGISAGTAAKIRAKVGMKS